MTYNNIRLFTKTTQKEERARRHLLQISDQVVEPSSRGKILDIFQEMIETAEEYEQQGFSFARRFIAMGHEGAGLQHLREGNPELARDHFAQSVPIREELERSSDDPLDSFKLATACMGLGDSWAEGENADLPKTEECYGRTLDILARLDEQGVDWYVMSERKRLKGDTDVRSMLSYQFHYGELSIHRLRDRYKENTSLNRAFHLLFQSLRLARCLEAFQDEEGTQGAFEQLLESACMCSDDGFEIARGFAEIAKKELKEK